MSTKFSTSESVHSLQARLTRLFKQTITYVVLVSLQLGSLTQTKEAYAQYVPPGGQPNTGYVAPSISAPVSAANSAPFSGYNPDGTLFMGGQRIGNPHQVLHDAQIPAFMTITANRYTYSADPTHGQGTLAQMELATTNGSTSSVLLNRLYLSPNNPYATTQPLGQVWPYPNYQTYQGVLLNSQQAGYFGTTAQDGKNYFFKTLTAASAQAFTILINELPNTPQFRAAADPAGGGVGVRVSQNGDAVALANYYKTVQPYNYNWQPNYGAYTGTGQNGQLDPMYRGWVNSPGGTYSGFDGNLDGANGQQTNQQRFDAFIQQQQNEALANDKRVRSQTSANSLDLSSINPNTLYGQGYNLFDYGNASNPNLALENEYLRKLQNGEFNAGSADYNEASRIAQERYRIAYATRLETNKPLQYSVSGAQNKANELKLADTNPNLLFGDGYDLFNYDPLTNPNGAAENALLMRLQSGQLTPGTPEYEQASQIAQQRYRNAYATSLAFNIAPKFTVAEAQRKANAIDLSQVNPNDLFGQGFDLFQYNPALRPNGEAENVLLAKLQNGELTAGSPEYIQATQIAQERLRVAYSQSLVPPEPKKVDKWKLIVGVVVGAVLTFVTAGAAAPYILSALTGMTVSAAGVLITGGFLTGTLLGAAVTAGAAIVGGYVGAVVSTSITTGNLSQGLRAGEKVLVSGTVKGFVTTILASSLGLAGLEGMDATLGNIAVNSLSGGITQTILNGGSFADNLKTAAVNSVVDEIAKGAANKIGDAFPNLDGTNLANYAAHGVLGCASAAAKGADCAAGAIGAMTGEAAAASGFLDAAANSTIGRTLNKDEIVFFGGLVGGTTAALASNAEDVNANFATGTATASNAVANNYLNHASASRLAALRGQANCNADCKNEIEALVKLDADNNKALANCDGVKSTTCDSVRQEVRTAAAEYIRKDVGPLAAANGKDINTYNSEKSETISLAQGTMSGVTQGVGTGFVKTVAEGFVSVVSGAYQVGKAWLGDPQAQQTVKDGAGAMWDTVKDPNNWPYLVGAMTPADREKLAVAYETGNGKAVGEIMGASVANLPIGGGGFGTTKKIGGVFNTADDAAMVAGATKGVKFGGTVELFTDANGPKVSGAVGVGPTTPGAVAADARSMPNIPSSSQAQVVANNPFIPPEVGGTGAMMDYLPEAARITQPGGQIIINGTNANKYLTNLPTQAQLDILGLKIQYQGPLLPQFQGMTFLRTDGSKLTAPMQSIVLIKK